MHLNLKIVHHKTPKMPIPCMKFKFSICENYFASRRCSENEVDIKRDNL